MKALALLVLTVFNVAVAFKSVSKLSPMGAKLHMNGKVLGAAQLPSMGSVLPMDSPSFKSLRDRGKIYVDKTKAIYDCILNAKAIGTMSFEFIRPRRFGKSLLCSTLAECFGGRESKHLFADLWLGQEDSGWDFEAEAVPVVSLDMSRCAGRTKTASTFNAAVRMMLNDCATRLGVKIEVEELPSQMLTNLVRAVSKKNGNKRVPVIIDEYDKPVLDVLFKPTLGEVRNALNSFYSPLKSLQSEDTVGLLFFTGLQKFSQQSAFPSLNHLSDISLNYNTGALVGYTEEEMQSKLMAGPLGNLATELKMEREPLLASLQDKYGGYRFGYEEDGTLSPSVLCPFAVNKALNLQDVKANHWGLSGSSQLIVDRLKNENQAYGPEQLVDPDDLRRSYDDFHSIPLRVLMYSTGYLTINKYDAATNLLHLAPPNTMVHADVVKGMAFKR